MIDSVLLMKALAKRLCCNQSQWICLRTCRMALMCELITRHLSIVWLLMMMRECKLQLAINQIDRQKLAVFSRTFAWKVQGDFFLPMVVAHVRETDFWTFGESDAKVDFETKTGNVLRWLHVCQMLAHFLIDCPPYGTVCADFCQNIQNVLSFRHHFLPRKRN